ncbi:MAG TPA: hypothetical protein PKL73_03465 [Polyangiaceae bacterium]|nr:hypothetical protein [Polyangiaceae bacterium]HOR35624.1 hypothetical protein [Polyangiaceae bacterium]HOT10627.1 hypothetical protein [Polyangiaceae bacterium]HPK93502.1 hypothetical protein [Polyangiaceae bacterium]HPY17100.1 hypothetical protein [Polyangiaceae bacterium]
MGDAVKDAKLSDSVSGQIPIWLDVGYRIDESLFVGAYGQYGITMVKDCPDGVDCSASDIRFGVQGHYHFMPGESFDVWAGLGIGYEMLSSSAKAGGHEASSTLSGFEFANLQVGGDFQVAEGMGVGPFVSFSLGQYGKVKAEVPGAGTSDGDIEDKGMHQWLLLGVRGSFQL